MPKYWMINDRSQGGVGPDVNTDGMTYWVSDKQPLTDINNWRRSRLPISRNFWSLPPINFLRMTRRKMKSKVMSQSLYTASTKPLLRPRDFIRTFAPSCSTVRTVLASVFCTIGHHEAAPLAMSLIVHMRACALTI